MFFSLGSNLKAEKSAELPVSKDVVAVPPPWPFSVSGSESPSVSSVSERRPGGVWRAECPPLAEVEPDFTDQNVNAVCVTSPPLEAQDMEQKSPLTTNKPLATETRSDKEVTLFITEDEEESPKPAKLKEEPVNQTNQNQSDEDKVTITDIIISSLLRSEDEKKPEQEHDALRDSRQVPGRLRG